MDHATIQALTLPCPTCHFDVQNEGGRTCSQCKVSYEKTPFCPDCSHKLDAMKACGNVGYYCNQCRMPKSRAAIVWKLTPVK
ncbi:zinc-ribbon domain-containing protein [Vibrio maritimus]|uniref:YfgJ family double zinc ribbon protein n=1 Tax=Vibrio maritimus TaxID=990268 RepID=UPI0037365DC3